MTRFLSICLLSFLGVAPGLALAQQGSLLDAARKLPLRTGRADAPLLFGFRDGSRSLLLEVRGDKLTATEDGLLLPADRLVRRLGRWFVLDITGGVAADLRVTDGAGHLRTHTDRSRVSLGITVNTPSAEKLLVYELGPRDGLEVLAVKAETGAARGGIRVGDVIVAVGTQRPVTRTTLRQAIQQTKVGSQIPLTVLRGGEEAKVVVVLEPDYHAYAREVRPAAPAATGDAAAVLRTRDDQVVLVPPAQDELREEMRGMSRRLARLEAMIERLLEQKK